MVRRILSVVLGLSTAFPANAAPIVSRMAAPSVGAPIAGPMIAGPSLLQAPQLGSLNAPILGGTLPILTLPETITDSRSPAIAQTAPTIILKAAIHAAHTTHAAHPQKKEKKKRPVLHALRILKQKAKPSKTSTAQAPLNHFFDLNAQSTSDAPAVLTPLSRSQRNLLSQPSVSANAASDSAPPTPKFSMLRNLGSSGWLYIAYLSLVQAGIGAYAPVFPEMAIEQYGGAAYGLAASLAVIGMPIAAIGAKKLAKNLGAKGGLAAALVGVSITSAALFVAFGANALPWIGLVGGLTAVQGSFAAMRTLDKVIPGQLYGRDNQKLKRFNGISFAVSRLPGILVPLAIGPILAIAGQYGALAIFSIAMLAAVPIVRAIKTNESVKEEDDKITKPDAKLLRLSGWGFASQQIMTYVLPFILVSAYGRYAGGGDPIAAKEIGGMLFSLWTVGLLGGTLALIRSAGRAKPIAALRKAALIGAVGFLGFAPLLWSSPYAAYAGIALAGYTSAYSFIAYLSTAQANAPSDNRAGPIARYMMFSFLVVAAAVWGLGALIQAFPASAVPFGVLLAGLGGLSLLNLWIAAKLRGRES